ncbi:hypothetical protein Tco_1070101 [Tanacetum coccineum]|uniref:Uncharacterized protein n=1 Tax=Tanacetum coccineum TaxID=301880 RepID=A0ABQ5HLK2_9ASTR
MPPLPQIWKSPLVKDADADADDVDEHLYRSMIGSLIPWLEALTDGNAPLQDNATIDGHSLSITEGSIQRRHLNPKKTAWEQFSSNIAAAVICLATNRKFNFSRMIFEHMGMKFSDEEVQEKASADTELFIQEVTPTEVIQNQEGSGKASDEVSTAGLKKGPVSEEVPIVSTAEVNLSTASLEDLSYHIQEEVQRKDIEKIKEKPFDRGRT